MSGADAAAPAIGLIWAEAEGGVIGREGGMPWHVPEDLAHFTALTVGAPVVMGRKTWDSLSPRFRPLPGRRNIVVTRRHDWSADGAEVARSVDDALAHAVQGDVDRVWVIGGAQLFADTIGRADRLEVTELRHDDDAFDAASGDVIAPAIDSSWRVVATDPTAGWHTSRSGIRYRFLTYSRA
jgi:dihydrofolate reductase